jgi:hypothetical protein
MKISSILKTYVDLVLPCFNKLTIDYEKGVYTFCESFNDYVSISEYSENDRHSIHDYIMNAFEILDTILEENPATKGKTYSEKYDLIEKDTDYKIVFSQIYLLLTVFRNAEVHDKESVAIDNNNIVINRNEKKGKDIKLVVKYDIIKFLLSYAIYYNNVQTIKLNECYKINIALWYFEKIISLISEYKEGGNNIDLTKPKNSSVFSEITNRYICENILYEKKEDKITFNIKQDYLFSSCKKNNCIDFMFIVDNKSYMIPFEIAQNGTVSICDLKDFVFNE